MKVFRNRVKMTVLALVMVACMVASVLTGFGTVEAKADLPQTPVQYAAYNQDTGEFTTDSRNAYVIDSDADNLTLSNGQWYAFKGNVTITNRVTVPRTVNIILMDGCVFTASKGINVASGNTLNIFGQGTINAGKLIATGNGGDSGIGGEATQGGGKITINGGIVTATGSDGGAGIGGGKRGPGGTITINGGIVTATGGDKGAGIGGGKEGTGGGITINGGIVTATGVDGGAGIGGGEKQNGGIITINGGIVTAAGVGGGAGIGGGYKGHAGTTTINGGSVSATGGNYGVGTGDESSHPGGGIGDLNSVMKCFTSASETSGYIRGSNSRYVLVYKEQSAFMTASGSAITAKYIKDREKKNTELTIQAPTEIVYDDDTTAQARLIGWENFNSELDRRDEPVSESQIKYYYTSGRLLNSAPTLRGTYIAQITVDGVTATVNYAITKDDPVISVSAATGLAYTGDDQPLITQGRTSGGTLKYSLSRDGEFRADIPTGRGAGDYTVYYKVEGNDDFKSSKTYNVSTQIRKANLNLSLTQSGWVKGEQSVSPVLGGNAGNGAVTYAYKKQSDDDNTYSGSVPTEAGNYIIKATVAETSNYFGASTTAAFTISEPAVTTPDSESESETVITTPDPNPESTIVTPSAIVIATPVINPEPVAEKKAEVPKPSIFTRENKDGSVTTIEIIWNADGTTTVINEVKQADGTVERKEETRDSKGNGTLKIEKKDALGNLLSSTEGTIKVNKKGTETIKSTTINSDGSREEKTQKTYKRDPAADNVKKVTINVKKTDAAGNTEVIKTTAFVGVLGDATVTEKSEYTFAAADGNGAGKDAAGSESKSGTGKAGNKTAGNVVKEERQYSLSVNGRLKLLSLTSDGEKVTIPENIELDGMKRVVKSIGKNALKGNKTVKSVEIGENITTICSGAFKNCKNLELIVLTGSIKTIYKNAFKGIARNAKFVIRASEEDFARIVELIKKSGVDESVTFERAE